MMLLLPASVFSQNKYGIQYSLSGKDTSNHFQQLDLKTIFDTKEVAIDYIDKLPAILSGKGFATASVDSVTYDSAHAGVKLYLGEKYKWVQISTHI